MPHLPIRHLPTLLILGALAGPGHAATVTGDTFRLGFFDGPGEVAPSLGAVVEGTAGAAGNDVEAEFENGTFFTVDWVDDDSVDVSFFGGFGATDGFDLAYTLSSLDFALGGVATPITGVTFNRGASNIDEFLGDEEIGQPPLSAFQEPVLSFTDTSFTATFAFFDSRLIGDGPRLRYDVAAGPAAPPPVPLPAAMPLLAGALGLLVAWRRRG